MTPIEIKKEIEKLALDEGLLAGFAPVGADLKREYFEKWIAEGKNAGMKWMASAKRTDPKRVLPECRSVVVLGLNYFQKAPERRGEMATYAQGGPDFAHGIGAPEQKAKKQRNGRIAMYALGQDYHDIMLPKLKRICAVMESRGGQQKPYVDTGPVLEKRFGAATVLGWQGKNTMLISPEYGTWLFLGVILTTLELPADAPHPDRCGSCSRCMKACPTGAITAPYQLDARKCIAYWTIEHKGEIPQEFHKAIGNRLFGCDDCLEACPWNKFARESSEMRLKARKYPGAEEILEMDEAGFERTFKGSPIHRLGLERLKRNARIVAGNAKNQAPAS